MKREGEGMQMVRVLKKTYYGASFEMIILLLFINMRM